MKINILTKTVCTPMMHLIDSPDFVYKIRIEIWKQQETLQYFATAERSFYCNLHVLSENRVATEMIRSAEELLEIEDEFFDNEQLALENVLKKLPSYYAPV